MVADSYDSFSWLCEVGVGGWRVILPPLEHLAVSGDIGCQNLEEAQGVIRASGGWRPRMLVNIHWTAPTPPIRPIQPKMPVLPWWRNPAM